MQIIFYFDSRLSFSLSLSIYIYLVLGFIMHFLFTRQQTNTVLMQEGFGQLVHSMKKKQVAAQVQHYLTNQ